MSQARVTLQGYSC